MTGHVLFGEDSERTFFTPMFFTEKFEFLRHVEIMRKLFYSVGAAERPTNSSVVQQTEPVVQQMQKIEESPAIEKTTPNAPQVIEISKKKGKALAGQFMFDFGEIGG